MCQAIVKPANKVVDFKKLDNSQKYNKDGYGVSWFEDGEINTFKTLNYNRFKGVLSTLKNVECIIHLRNATRGKISSSNIHPFNIPSGVFFHNGTIMSLKGAITDDVSDSKKLADILNDTVYTSITDITKLLAVIAGETINRFIFMDKKDGKVHIINKELGLEEDGIWYSNDYHIKGACTVSKPKSAVEYVYNIETRAYEARHTDEYKDDIPFYMRDTYEELEVDLDEDELVFVYGTLKRGQNNHYLLKDSLYLGKATTKYKWHMIGQGMSFPYLLEKAPVIGHNVEGEVYLVSPKTKRALDSLEGVPYHYREETIEVMYEDTKEVVEVTTYVKTNVNAVNRSNTPIKVFTK